MIDFGHKKVGKFNFLTCAGFYAWQKMEMRLFMWLDFYLHFWDCTKTRQRNEVLRDCFTASLLNGSLVFFLPSQKPPKRSWWFYWPIWQVTTSGNLHISSINDQQESPLPISMPTRSNHVVICDKQQNHFEGGSQKNWVPNST